MPTRCPDIRIMTGMIVFALLVLLVVFAGCGRENTCTTAPTRNTHPSVLGLVNGSEVKLDVKPGSCPNPINPYSKGRLPVAILGTPDLDVRDIDVSSLLLEGVAPVRTDIEDVSTPVAGGHECDCASEGPDGYDDLTLKFDTQELVGALGGVACPGDSGPLTIIGSLLDGTPFEARDCAVIVGKKPKGHEFEPLGFPLSTPSHAVRLAAFGIPNWSGPEPHNGIDLIVDEALERTEIISPTNGTVVSIRVSENQFSNPPNQMLLEIELWVNAEWRVALTIEPSTVDEQLKAEQLAAVEVEVGQSVVTGDRIADLITGDLGYPHLHYMLARTWEGNWENMCAYEYSTESARGIFESIPKTDDSDGYICYEEQQRSSNSIHLGDR